MEKEPKEIIVLGAIKQGVKKFDKIQKTTLIDPKELHMILEKLESGGFIKVEEKKGLLGNKIEIRATEKGRKEVDERIHEMQIKWNQMAAVYKTGDKENLKQCMDDNKSFLPMMMFFGVMDMMMFSMMFSMMGIGMGGYVPTESMPEGTDGGMDDDGGFDFDIGF